MKLKHTAVYAIADVRRKIDDSTKVEIDMSITLAVDKDGRPLTDTNKRVLEGKLEVLQSLVDEFKDYKIINVNLTSVAL